MASSARHAFAHPNTLPRRALLSSFVLKTITKQLYHRVVCTHSDSNQGKLKGTEASLSNGQLQLHLQIGGWVPHPSEPSNNNSGQCPGCTALALPVSLPCPCPYCPGIDTACQPKHYREDLVGQALVKLQKVGPGVANVGAVGLLSCAV
jgi:hypothetical protein